MSAVIHRTTLQYIPSVNEPDYPEPTWKWNPNMSAVIGVPQQYWKAPADWTGDAGPLEMTAGEKTAADAAAASAENSAARDEAVAEMDLGDKLAKLMKAFAGVLADELSLRPILVGEATQTWDPASMTNGTGLTSPNFTVNGAAFGDYVDVCASISLAGVVAIGYVSASNTVNVRLHNSTGSAVNLASATWKVAVRRTVTRTLAQAKTAVIAMLNSGAAD